MKGALRYLVLPLCIILIILATNSFISLAQGATKIPHGKTGFEACLSCHGERGSRPIPASHRTYNQETCLNCHLYATPVVSPGTTSSGTTPASTADSLCLSCHEQPTLSMTLQNGGKFSLYVDGTMINNSVHGKKLLCTDCHNSINGYPHQKLTVTSQREYSLNHYEVCKKCHFENYTKNLDSVHYKVLMQGDTGAPLCTDCHGAHNVSQPDAPRAKISTTCSKCHSQINSEYLSSVHGKALIEDNNFDVPVCTDCHQSHTIEDPRTASFRIKSIDLCSNCHGNDKLMQKYNISTNVVQSYLQDFHGATVALVGEQNKDIWVETAVCIDCHGVHNIRTVTDSQSAVIKANLVTTCQKCHPDATTNFPSAWLSHYEPSLTKAPTVFLAQWFYKFMIPFILVGLCAHILLDLWRAITNR